MNLLQNLYFLALRDLQFIRQIFPNGLINNEATVSQLLAVKSSTAADAHVVAGIYGGGVQRLDDNGFKDATHRKLMIFAGASDINHVASAATRIYEDGTLITSRLIATNADITGKITATSGKIGGFEISGITIKYGSSTIFSPEFGLYLKRLDNEFYTFGGIVPTHTKEEQLLIEPTLCIIAPTAYNNNCMPGVYIYGPVVSNIDIKYRIYDENAMYGPHALLIEHGDICGFRLRTRRIGSSKTLSKMDSIILVKATSAVTMTLPADPENGQLYFIKSICEQSRDIILTVGASDHRINNGRSLKNTSWKWSGGQIVMVIWDDANKTWQAGFTNYD